MQLRPSFNRPKLYTTLLSNEAQGIKESIPVYSSVILDEYTMRTPDAIMSGVASEQLIHNCCPTIEHPEKLLMCDIQHLLTNIKIASNINAIDLLITCPCKNCSTQDKYEFNLTTNTNILSAKKWFSPIILADNNLTICLQPPTYEEFSKNSVELFKIKKQLYQIYTLSEAKYEDYENLTKKLTSNLQKIINTQHIRCIKKIIINNSMEVSSPKYITEWFNNSDINTQNQIISYINSANKQCYFPDITVSCSKCKTPISGPINLDYCEQFRNQLIKSSNEEIINTLENMNKETSKFTDNLLHICWHMRGSISYDEAFYLTIPEIEIITKIIDENAKASKNAGFPIY